MCLFLPLMLISTKLLLFYFQQSFSSCYGYYNNCGFLCFGNNWRRREGVLLLFSAYIFAIILNSSFSYTVSYLSLLYSQLLRIIKWKTYYQPATKQTQFDQHRFLKMSLLSRQLTCKSFTSLKFIYIHTVWANQKHSFLSKILDSYRRTKNIISD